MGRTTGNRSGNLTLGAMLFALLAILATTGVFSACKNPLAAAAKDIKEVAASPLLVVALNGGASVGNGKAFDFGEQGLSDPATTQLFTLTNSGKAALTISSSTITGTDSLRYAFVGSPPGSLAPQATATFSISFLPGTAGSKTASVVLVTNDVSNPTYTISLKGVGINSVPMPELAGGNFQCIPGTDPATVTLTCTDGTATIYYTIDGSTPTESIVNKYTSTVYPNFSNTLTVKAIAVAPGFSNSSIMKATFSRTSPAAPTLNQASQTFLSGPNPRPLFTLSCESGAKIVFTIDGTEPDADNIATVISAGSNPTVIDGGTYFLPNGAGFYAAHVGASLNLRAKAYTTTGTVNIPSTTETTATYQFKLSPPSFASVQPSATYYGTAQAVTLARSSGAGGTATIHYTTSAAPPVTATDPAYTAAITVPAGAAGSSNSMTIQAMATQTNWQDSDILSGTFYICGPGIWGTSLWDQASWQ